MAIVEIWWGSTNYGPNPGLKVELGPAGYALQGNLGATIAFGWHRQSTGDNVLVPSINQRVINESALVAASL